MKFEFIESNSSNVGLVMSKGVSGNIVFFWDENEDAAEYDIEIYRCPLTFNREGFVKSSTIVETEIMIEIYGHREKGINFAVQNSPAIVDGKLAGNNEWQDGDFYHKVKRSQVVYKEFNEIKPICVEIIERNRFYKSFNDLAVGDYIAILKIMNRKGEEITRSYPYYFSIKAVDIVGELAPLIRSVGPNVVG